MGFEYWQIEDELVSVVQSKITESSLSIEVAVYPDTQEDYKRAVTKPRVIIGFTGVTMGENMTMNEQAGVETITIIALIQARKKRGDDGCHHIAGLVKKWLSGYEPSNCSNMMYKSYKGNDIVYDADNGIWSWDLEFNCTKLFVQDVPPDGPLLNQVSFNDQI